MGTAGLVRAAGPKMRSPRWAAASLCLSAALVACAGQPVPGAAVTRLAGALSAVSARSAASAWAVGQTSASKTLVLRWNGTRWARVPSPSPGAVDNALSGLSVVSASSAWAVGSYGGSPGSKTLVLHWNGASWAQLASPSPGISGLSGVSAVSATDAWAVGSSDNHAGMPSTLVLHWNGAGWARVPSPSPGAQGAILNAVSAVSASDAWAVGQYVPSTGVGKTLLLHWNGASWAQVAGPSPGVHDADLSGVSVLSASGAWAVGSADTSTGANLTLVLHWNGTSWTQF